ncbi:MAG: putative toxin-antitoxin system toxin component, PIN family [Candidatus Liptonbacteria bacterium]|nr:putative toxin-antitoxin system toxin component, PIN family [Candidatus Liptonbacteria bacterium]
MSSVPIRAVLDTNVMVSALFWRGVPYSVLRKGIERRYAILISPAIIEEIFSTLVRKFAFPSRDAREFLEMIVARSTVVIPTTRVRAIRTDPADNKILECAIAGGATHIVTGDKDILTLETYQKIKIVTPARFLKHAL